MKNQVFFPQPEKKLGCHNGPEPLQNNGGRPARRFDVREQRELPHVATLANGLAKALGENAHAESNDDLHSYELQLEVPKKSGRLQPPNVGVGWLGDGFLFGFVEF